MIDIKKGLPHLKHFFVDKKYRNATTSRLLINKFKEVVRQLGFNQAYIHAETKDRAKMIQYYFKKEPFTVQNKAAWFLVDIQGV